MELRDAATRLLIEKYKLEDKAVEEIKKLQEEIETLRSTCNYLSEQYNTTHTELTIVNVMLDKIADEYPELNLDLVRHLASNIESSTDDTVNDNNNENDSIDENNQVNDS